MAIGNEKQVVNVAAEPFLAVEPLLTAGASIPGPQPGPEAPWSDQVAIRPRLFSPPPSSPQVPGLAPTPASPRRRTPAAAPSLATEAGVSFFDHKLSHTL